MRRTVSQSAQPTVSQAHASAEPLGVAIRHVEIADAAAMWRMVRDCDVLDTNSCYAYLLLCRDFSATSLVATDGDRLLGFVTAYLPPERPDVAFVWQIAAAPEARGRGVGRSLLRSLLRAPACRGVRFLEATVAPSNVASERLFRSIASELNSPFHVSPGFASDDFRSGADSPAANDALAHEPENLVRIGPLEEHP